MDKNFSPIVISSKRAKYHLNDIKFKHAETLKNLQEHNMKISQIKSEKENQNKVAEQEKKSSEMESNKSRMDGEAKILEQQNKAKELAIKEQALSL